MSEAYKKIQGIAFDLEGTVIDLEFAHHEGHIRAARDVGLEMTLDECLEKIAHFIGGPDEKIAEEIAAFADADPAYVLVRDKFHYDTILATVEYIEPREGFFAFLDRIQARGIKCAIGSLTPKEYAAPMLSKSGLLQRIPTIVLREDVKNQKPAPDVFLETARRMGIDPKHQLVFEDSPRGIKAACAAFSPAIGMPVYDKPHVIDALTREGAHAVFKHWNEVDIDHFLS